MLARAVVLLIALGVIALGVARGTWAAGGSDSSCYALMADAFARGELQPRTLLAAEAPWPDAARTFAPAGFIPSPVRRDAASPICAPGFALLLAPLRAVAGPDGIFLLTPVAAGVLVWLTFVFGRLIAGEWAGTAAAAIVAATPVFLFQLMQPMNDVVVAALWTAVLTLAALEHPVGVSGGPSTLHGLTPSTNHGLTPWLGGLAGLAILVRPNLAPVALVVAGWIALTQSWRRAVVFAVCAAPLAALTAVLNFMLYGHPLTVGYGSTGDLFSPRHVAANIGNYGRALFDTQLGLPLLGLVAAFVVQRELRSVVWLVLGVVFVVAATYLLYSPFAEWWYLRFFLPVLPALTVLAIASVQAITRRSWVVAMAAVAVIAFAATTEATGQALGVGRLESRFRTTGRVVRERLPANAMFITVWESGTVKYHADRDALLWDGLDPTWLDGAIEWLQGRGFEPFIMLEDWEEPAFRHRFNGHSIVGALDWPPRFAIDRRVRIFSPGDRSRHLAGHAVPTDIVWGDRR
jgi:uncharacterized membrane protein